ncbi:MAG: hypothetical protein ACK2T3_16440 [Candidatus Promineifilaceae bacterium]
MNRKQLFVVIMLVISLFAAVTAVAAEGNSDLAKVRASTARFHRPEAAQAAGWDLRAGLDFCFDNPGVGGMGYHYISSVDATVNELEPEAMVYAPGPNGNLQLAAVEYIVDKIQWDFDNPGVLPQALGQEFHALNSELYVLHAWIWMNNPSGMFEDWNPNVSCS